MLPAPMLSRRSPRQVADKSLTWVNRRPSAPLRQGSRYHPPHGAAGPSERETKMEKISSFKIAAGMFGIAALVKISVFAIAIAMLGLATSA